jgi:hypothetical protein
MVVGVMEGQEEGQTAGQHPEYYMALLRFITMRPAPGSCWFEWQERKGLVSAVPWVLSIEYHLHSLSF